MEVRYSKHLEVRLKMRGIPYELPRIIFENSRKRFHDVDSGLKIAVLRLRYFGRQRDVAVAYQVNTKYVLLVTVHPLKPNQLENRLRSGRWKKI